MDGGQIIILGGYGTTGRLIARGLLQKTGAGIIVAGRDIRRAREFAEKLNSEFHRGRAAAAKVDASNIDELRRAFDNATMVVVASSTAMFVDLIVRAALDCRIDYYDIQYSSSKVAYLKSVSKRIEELGLCFITDGGFHPGLPGVLARWAGSRFDSMEKAAVSSLIRIDWKRLDPGKSTIREFLAEMSDYDSSVFVDGTWRRASFLSSSGYMKEDFGEPFGRRYCAPMFLEELRIIPELYPSLKKVGFYVGGFNWFVDYFVFPPAFAVMKLWPSLGVNLFSGLMLFGVKAFARPPYSTILKLRATGSNDGSSCELTATLSHEDGYALTALPVVGTLKQCFEGSLRKPGLFTQASIVDPGKLLEDLVAMGAAWKVGWEFPA